MKQKSNFYPSTRFSQLQQARYTPGAVCVSWPLSACLLVLDKKLCDVHAYSEQCRLYMVQTADMVSLPAPEAQSLTALHQP